MKNNLLIVILSFAGFITSAVDLMLHGSYKIPIPFPKEWFEGEEYYVTFMKEFVKREMQRSKICSGI